ncbi:uncharacterized protein LOC124997667 [Mugil cephalus]|uniref:uncharacterized protein LOC124997667 n=1 Tax=Mugil cephalus TaxID=48193 RepID=UPI001FB5EE1A|nr:uncharacterized protein LOC124997667 [Mugil cephalus]
MASKPLKTAAEELRIVVLGKDENKNRELINKILGTEGMTKGVYDGVPVVFTEGPGLLSTNPAENPVKVIKGIACIAPGPHVFLYVKDTEPFTTVEQKEVKTLLSILKGSKSHFLGVVLNNGPISKDDEREINNSFMKDFGNGFIVFNKREPNVSEIMKKIKKIGKKGHYTNKFYEKMDPKVNLQDIIIAESKEVLSKLLGEDVYDFIEKCIEKAVEKCF